MKQVLIEKSRRRTGAGWEPQADEALPLDPRDLDVVLPEALRRRKASNESRKARSGREPHGVDAGDSSWRTAKAG